VLLIEDADGPAPAPLLHAAAWNIAPEEGGLTVGALSPGGPLPMARNSFGRTGYTPIDCPTGHGVHRYVFQLLALSGRVSLAPGATRDQLMRAVFGRVLATGEATATYVRPASRDNGLPTLALAAVIGGAAYAVARARRRRAERRAELRAAAPVRFTPDVERIAPDEVETFERIAEVMRNAGAVARERDNNVARASHAKAHALVTGALEVLPGLPPELAQGVFQPGRRYEAVARLSHVPAEILDDRGPSTPRSLALKLFGLEGGATQDFLFDSGDPRFHRAGCQGFSGGDQPDHLRDAAADRGEGRGVGGGARGQCGAERGGRQQRPPRFLRPQAAAPAGETYWSQAPQRHGDYIAKYRVRPLGRLRALIDETVKLDAPDALRDAVTGWFETNAAEFVLEAQLCRDLAEMPVENALKKWDEELSPYVPVARLRFPAQQAWGPEQEALGRRLSFSPVHFIEEHRPLGSVQRARLYVYPLLANERRSLAHEDQREPRSLAELAPDGADRAVTEAAT
jgi:hypothetical protein